MALDMDQGDWIPVFRKLRESWIWRDGDLLRAWLDLLMMANRRESRLPHAGHLLPVEPGQLPTSIQALAKRWKWSRDRVGRFLNMLRVEGSIEIARVKWGSKTGTWINTTSDRSISLLTVVNSPVRQKWLKEHADKPADLSADQTSKTGRRLADDVADHQQQPLQYPRQQQQGERVEGGEVRETPSGASKLEGDPTRGTDGEDQGLAVVAGPGKAPESPQDPAPAHGPSPRSPLLDQVNSKRSLQLLLEIEVREKTAHLLAKAHPVGKVFDAVEASRGAVNRGGWVIKALDEGYDLAPANGPALAQLTQLLEGDAAVAGGVIERRTNTLGIAAAARARLPGESEDEWLRRIQAAPKPGSVQTTAQEGEE